MKKLIFKFWGANVLFSVVLFIIYRLVISERDYDSDTWFDTVMNILDILINLGYSLAFLIGMLIGSLTFFLNLIDEIRNRYYLSLLSFVAIPVGVVVFALVASFDLYSAGSHLFTTFLVCAVVYLVFNWVQFLVFRKRIGEFNHIGT